MMTMMLMMMMTMMTMATMVVVVRACIDSSLRSERSTSLRYRPRARFSSLADSSSS